MLVNTHKLKIAFLLLLIGVMNLPLQAEEWTLEQCIDTAQVKNKMLLMSKTTVAIGEQRHKEAVAGLIPKLTVNGDYKYYIDLPYQINAAIHL